MNRIAVAVAVAVANVFTLAAPAAHATSQGIQVIKKWKTMDYCTKQAQMAFPDFTAEANAKRDAAIKACLAGNNLPPREQLAPVQ